MSRHYDFEDDLSFPDMQLKRRGWCDIDERRQLDRSRYFTELVEQGRAGRVFFDHSDYRGVLPLWDGDVVEGWRQMAFVARMAAADGYWPWLQRRVSSWS
jgi:hypothetical protein